MRTKILFLFSAVMIIAGNISAQWTGGSGSPIYNVNLGDNVGIGTSTPSNNLEVQGNTAIIGINAITNVTSPSSGNPAIIYRIDGTLKFAHGIDHANNDDFKIMRSGTNICMTILQSNGNVGIGTQTPGNLFEVTGGDINAQTVTTGFKINNAYMLWHNNKTGSIYVGGAGSSSATGGYNTLTGSGAGTSASFSGNNNTFNGYQAGNANTSAGNNTLIGYQAGKSITATSDNVAVGYQALFTQSFSTGSSSYNTAVGYKALYTNNPTATGTNGNYNTAVGSNAMQNNTTGYYNTAFGSSALLGNTIGYFNTAIGLAAADACTSSNHTTAVGGNALTELISGNKNTAIGYSALRKNDYGDNNTAVGYAAGGTITSGSGNTFLGQGADATTGTWSNCTAIGYGASVDGDGYVVIGNTTVNNIGGWKGWTNKSDGRFKFNVQENVKGLDFVKKLRPVTYQIDTKKATEFLTKNMPDSIKSLHINNVDFSISTAEIHSGFIAQEVEQAAQTVGFTSSIVNIPSDTTTGSYGIGYAELVVPLVKAVQELSITVDSLKQVLNNCCSTKQERKTNSDNRNNPSGENSNQKENLISVELVSNSKPVLFQNEPNPFDNSTVIRYFLPENVNNAFVIFYDEMGREIKKIELKESGNGKIEALTVNLASGIYTYSMIVEGKIVETHKMLRNK